ncbi:MAG: RNA polymerase sigma factor [Roseovarius sp.]
MPCSPEQPPITRDALAGLQPDLLRVARHLTGNADQAQDISQDTLLKIWTRQQKGEDIQNLRAYAMTTLRNTYRQFLRTRLSGPELTEDMLVTNPDAFASLALQELESAITRLPREQARLIRLVASGETSPAVLARRMGLPSGTVMSRLARARAQLRQDMGLTRRAPIAELI